MFEFFFKYPFTVFAQGEFVLLARWPVWALAASILVISALLGWALWLRRKSPVKAMQAWRPALIWLLQCSLAALILLLLWHPAIAVSTLKPKQNIVAVLVDDSRSMALNEDGTTRLEQARSALEGGTLASLQEKFQVRLYRFGRAVQRMDKLEQATGVDSASRISEALVQVAAEATGLPIGAVLLVSDGADTTGGISPETIAEIRRHRIPVHVLGVGRERPARDVEISDVVLPANALPDSRLAGQVTFLHWGYARSKAKLTVKDGTKVLASRDVTLGPDGTPQTESLSFHAGLAGVRNLEVAVQPLEGEENARNNAVTRLVEVRPNRPRVLYLEGEPRWEFKFVRRAMEEDRNVDLVSVLRTTQNKIYRQGIENPNDLRDGFPSRAEELFAFQGLVIGNVEAAYFTPSQADLVRQFADRRGGGVLFLGGRAALGDGGYRGSSLEDVLPAALPQRAGTFQREPAAVALTPAGQDSLVCRLVEERDKNAQRWTRLPALADYQDAGTPKPGAVVLAEMTPSGGRRLPLLITQNYGRGRIALFATSGSWRWQMLQEQSDLTHEMFWQQLLRWLSSESPGPVVVSTPRRVLADDLRVPIRVEARDKTYAPVVDASVEARIAGPGGLSGTVALSPVPQEPGVYAGEWMAEQPGSYLAEALVSRGGEEIGRDTLAFRREDGVAEHFRTGQNRELLERLAQETGGRYYAPSGLNRLAGEISYSEAGITTREPKDLWNMPAIFLALILLKAVEWFLRRRWGVI